MPTCTPDRSQLIVAEHTVSRSLIGGSVRADNWVTNRKAFAHCPIEEGGKRDPRAIRGYRSILAGYFEQPNGYCSAVDVIQPGPVKRLPADIQIPPSFSQSFRPQPLSREMLEVSRNDCCQCHR